MTSLREFHSDHRWAINWSILSAFVSALFAVAQALL